MTASQGVANCVGTRACFPHLHRDVLDRARYCPGGVWLRDDGRRLRAVTRTFVGYETFPRVPQLTSFTCAPCSVAAILEHYNRPASYSAIKLALRTDRDGTDAGPILRYLRRRGFVARPRCAMRMRDLEEALREGAVVLVYLDRDHIGVVYAMHRNYVYLADPSIVRCPSRRITRQQFRHRWDRDGIIARPT